MTRNGGFMAILKAVLQKRRIQLPFILLALATGVIIPILVFAAPLPKGASVDFVGEKPETVLLAGATATLHASDSDGINLEALTGGTATFNDLSGDVIGSSMDGGVLTVFTFMDGTPFSFIIDLNPSSPATVTVSGSATQTVFTLNDTATTGFGLSINLGKSGGSGGKGKGKKN